MRDIRLPYPWHHEKRKKDEAAARQSEVQEIVSWNLDGPRDSTRKAIGDARREISTRTASINEHKEERINAARDMAENYLESRRDRQFDVLIVGSPYREHVGHVLDRLMSLMSISSLV